MRRGPANSPHSVESLIVEVIAGLLLTLSLTYAALIYLPSPTWGAFKAHFVALETCLLGSAFGAGAWALTDDPVLRGLALVGASAGAVPVFGAIPAFFRERQRFSFLRWLTFGNPSRVNVRRDVNFAPGVTADIYLAPGAGPHPYVIVVHGGSWRSGDKGDVAHVSAFLATNGFTVIDLRYRLAPHHRFPSAIQDVDLARRVLAERAREFRIDPERGALLGRSAGGQIALVSAFAAGRLDGELPPPPLRAVISLYAPTELSGRRGRRSTISSIVDGTSAVESYLGGPPEEMPHVYRAAMPHHWIDQPVPPTLLIHGTAEQCVRAIHATNLHDALRARGHESRLVLIPFADHGFDVRPGGVGEQLARGVVLDFLQHHVTSAN